MGYIVAAGCVLAGIVGVGLLTLPAWWVLLALAGSQVVAAVAASATGRALARGVAACSTDTGSGRAGVGDGAGVGAWERLAA